MVAEKGFSSLKAPIRRVTTPNVAIPYAPNAEAHVIPGEARIAAAVRQLAGHAERVPA
jgi:acetoin:2,6-dichlorophenolindophenol oxidoreductase subunit beta